MTFLMISRPTRGGRHRLVEVTHPINTRGDLVVLFRERDRERERQTWWLFGGILAVGLAGISAPFLAHAWGWL